MHVTMRIASVFSALCCSAAVGAAAEFRVQQISDKLKVGYAVVAADVNADGRPDIVVVDTERVVWFENPSWKMATLVDGGTKPDNVCIAPYDVDGDGKLDFALGADWRPFDTRSGGTIQWLSRGQSPADSWSIHPIGTEPTVHRMQWIDLDADGRKELVVVPLMGRNSTPPHFAETPTRVLAYKVPADPVKGPWQAEVICEDLHVAHNFCPADLDHDGKTDLLVASFEGVSWLRRSADGRWSRELVGQGNQATSPNRGASEIKHGALAGGDYIATIEPWHGFQVVVYTRPPAPAADGKGLWTRSVLDEELKWGHAVSCADLDGDGNQELIVGVRDTKNADNPCGVRIYDPAGGKFSRRLLDPAGVAVEDLTVADLDGDGRQDIVAVGRATRNVRIYWNQGK